MLFKKYLNLSLIMLKSQRIIGIIPIVIYYVILPIINYVAYSKYGIGSELYNNIVTFMQMLIPLFSVWYGSFGIREFVEGDGRELLYINNKQTPMGIYFIILLFNMICLVPLISVYCVLFQNMFLECIRLYLIIVFFSCLSYALIISFRSLAIAFAVLLIYTLFSIFEASNSFFLFYFNTKTITVSLLLKESIPLAIVGVALAVIAHIRNLYSMKYI